MRRFKTDPLPASLVENLVCIATRSPSVGNSQPWRFVCVESESARQAVIESFHACNAAALKSYEGERASLYAKPQTRRIARGAGRETVPETLDYSVVAAVHTFWPAARAQGIGVGWVIFVKPPR